MNNSREICAAVEFRRAKLSDLPAITDIYNEAVCASTATFDTEPKRAEERVQWFNDHDDTHPILVAEIDGRVVGWSSLSRWSERRAYDLTAETSSYVTTQYRGKGIGRKLKEAMIEEARQLGFHTLLARIVAGNDESLHLNESLGFVRVGTMKEVGLKFGRFLDVHILQKMLREGGPSEHSDSDGAGGGAVMARRDSCGMAERREVNDAHEMRRKDRKMTEAEARELLERGEYGVLATVSVDGAPYGVPLSYCVIDNGIYFHCALEGHKLENIAADNRASFCVVGDTQVLPEKFSTRYESVTVSGRVTEIFDAEKQRGLEGLVAKYSAEFREAGARYIASGSPKTRVFRISIDAMCGKARR